VTPGPSRIAQALLRFLLPRSLRREALDELSDLHALRVMRDGREAADRWYRAQLIGFALRLRLAVMSGALTDGAMSNDRSRRRRRMATVLGDVRYAARTLVRNPAFTAVAVLTLALGIGANTAIFSVIRTVLLRPLPFPESERIVELWETRLDRGWDQASFTHANFWDVRDMNRTFESVAAYAGATLNLTGFEYPERLRGARVTADFFRVLGVTPAAGRTFVEGEDGAGADTRIAILSHAFWLERFGGDPSVVGRTVTLDGESHVVIGVLPRGSPWLDAAQVFLPLIRQTDANRGSFELAVIGRLAPGSTLEAARADLERIALRLAELYPEPDRGMGIGLAPSSTWIASDTLRRALWILMGGVGLLLLIACVNLANLLLARSTGRTRERAVRAALGASRGRIAGLVLTESLVVGLVGAVLGLGLALVLVRLLRGFQPGDIPRLGEVAVDGWVLAFTVGVALVTGVLTGLVPAVRSPYRDLAAALREAENRVMGSRRQGRLRGVLVGTEVALSLVLLVGAGLLLRSFGQLLNVDRGFHTEDRLFFDVGLPSTYDGARATVFFTQFMERVEVIPDVASVAAVNVRPLRGTAVGMGFAAPDRPAPSDAAVPWASWRLITRDYFRTMGLSLVAGRDFTDGDIIEDPWRVIISQSIAELLWPGENVIGRTMTLWQGQGEVPAEVIGVVQDMRDWGLEQGPTLAVYIPYYGATFSPAHFVLHTTGSRAVLVPRLRALLSEIDPNLPLANVQSLDEMVGESVASRRFTMLLLAVFAAVAVLLALAGVYGVLSYSIARRRAEIGMRIALGASRASVLRLVMGQGMRPVLFGLVLGLAGALALSRVMTGLLFEVTPADPATYIGVAVLLALAAGVSCYLPARSATRLDVVAALREE
jgi:predicted permease